MSRARRKLKVQQSWAAKIRAVWWRGHEHGENKRLLSEAFCVQNWSKHDLWYCPSLQSRGRHLLVTSKYRTWSSFMCVLSKCPWCIWIPSRKRARCQTDEYSSSKHEGNSDVEYLENRNRGIASETVSRSAGIMSTYNAKGKEKKLSQKVYLSLPYYSWEE
jgi:hypothetical protein